MMRPRIKEMPGEFDNVRRGDAKHLDPEFLQRCISPEGKISPQRRTGLTAQGQRKMSRAVKRYRCIGIISFVNPDA